MIMNIEKSTLPPQALESERKALWSDLRKLVVVAGVLATPIVTGELQISDLPYIEAIAKFVEPFAIFSLLQTCWRIKTLNPNNPRKFDDRKFEG